MRIRLLGHADSGGPEGPTPISTSAP